MISIGILAGLLAMLGWGVSDFMTSIPVRKLGTYKSLFLNFLLSVMFSLPVLFFKEALGITLPNLALLLFGVFVQLAAIIGFYRSMEIGELSIVVPISATYPLISVLCMMIFLGSKLTVLKTAAVFIMVLGIFLSSTDLKKLRHIHTTKGIPQAVTAMAAWGIYFFLIELVSGNYSLFGVDFAATHFLSVFFYSGILNGVVIAAYAFFRSGRLKMKMLTRQVVLIILFTQIIYAIVWLAVNYAFSLGYGAIVTPVSSLYPAVVVMLAGIFYKEKLLLNQKIGIGVILLGLLLISL